MVRAAALLLIPVIAAGEDTFAFEDFASTKGLSLVDDAHRSRKVLRLTDAARNVKGAAWFKVRQSVQSGFETTFRFRLTDQDSSYGGADGLAFVIQNEGPKAIGGHGAAAGFARSDATAERIFIAGIRRALAVFFDSYANPWDPSGNYLAICGSLPVPDLRWPPRCLTYSQKLPVDTKDGEAHTARITYDPPRLSVYLDEMEIPARAVSVDLASIIGSETAWVGFTAATGGGSQNHDLLSWRFAAGPRGEAVSSISMVSSTISFAQGSCLPNRTLCTPEQAVVQDNGAGQYHVYLPANLEWGASVPNAAAAPVRVRNTTGVVCWDPRLRDTSGCNGPSGNGTIPGPEADGSPGFLAPDEPAGALIIRTRDGRAWFSVNDRTGTAFRDNEGFFEFDVQVGSGPGARN